MPFSSVPFARITKCFLLLAATLFVSCGGGVEPEKPWVGKLRGEMNYLGARNWIVIGEAAFPAMNRRQMRVITIDADVPEVLDAVEAVIEEKHHVKPRIYTTSEIVSMPYDYAPGVKAHRKDLKEALHGRESIQLDNSMLMSMIKDTSRSYRVLVIKTRTALPYSSVFVELGSGYWDAESEDALRKSMEKKKP